jgi:hypothetical protein
MGIFCSPNPTSKIHRFAYRLEQSAINVSVAVLLWGYQLAKGQPDLFGGDETMISAPEKEMLNLVERRKNQHDRTTLSDLRDHFSKKPYGWSPMAIWCVFS